MAEKLKKLTDLFTRNDDGWWECKQCVYSTPHEQRARDHAQVKHLAELEPVRLIVPRRGEVKHEVIIEEEKG